MHASPKIGGLTAGLTRFITDSDSVAHQSNAINTRLQPLSVITCI